MYVSPWHLTNMNATKMRTLSKYVCIYVMGAFILKWDLIWRIPKYPDSYFTKTSEFARKYHYSVSRQIWKLTSEIHVVKILLGQTLSLDIWNRVINLWTSFKTLHMFVTALQMFTATVFFSKWLYITSNGFFSCLKLFYWCSWQVSIDFSNSFAFGIIVFKPKKNLKGWFSKNTIFHHIICSSKTDRSCCVEYKLVWLW